ncbi:hypothetical protein GZ998_06320 [Actinomyces sp. 594]|uniref:hypothetical protein n=1 Tax=Actinomyces sp. 594 TaxID=2057793 RepID=UPI001C59B54D|nr:hypothetical protein [Actinomyces sp. 594]MBW3069125.1 hypothetical protein [Actinomyces sp. 594]
MIIEDDAIAIRSLRLEETPLLEDFLLKDFLLEAVHVPEDFTGQPVRANGLPHRGRRRR